MSKRDYDSTIARIAGNILSGMTGYGHQIHLLNAGDVMDAVRLARMIVKEVQATEPVAERQAVAA